MLFISRYVGYEKYGVVDTDDGVEEFVTIAQLVGCLQEDIVINGVHSHKTRNGLASFIDEVVPYQLPEETTQLQVKTNLMKHVEVIVWNDIITCINIRRREITEPVTIRASDFAAAIGDCVFKRNQLAKAHKVTLILDDKVDITGISLCLPSAAPAMSPGVRGAGVVVDIREVRSDTLVEMVYRSFHAGNSLEMSDSIIDHRQRKKKWLRRLCGW